MRTGTGPTGPAHLLAEAGGLDISVARRSTGVLVDVLGEVESGGVATLAEVLDCVLGANDGPIVLDLSDATFCDRAVFDVLVRVRRRAAVRHRPLIVRAPGRPAAPGAPPEPPLAATFAQPCPAPPVAPVQPSQARAFGAQVERLDRTALVRMRGELDIEAVEVLDGLPMRFAPGTAVVVADLHAVAFMDLTGLEALARLEGRADRLGAGFPAVGWQPAPLRLLRSVGTGPVFYELTPFARGLRLRELRAAIARRSELRRAIGIADAAGRAGLARTLAEAGPWTRSAAGVAP
ncbi:Sulfate transporter/antisigma-factor antagonist STAS [Actinobacteria bacterium OV450]|nr:Sulfate transporter/antisigma-factor antagonist STAS [Actinobacteria bacterium OV450]